MPLATRMRRTLVGVAVATLLTACTDGIAPGASLEGEWGGSDAAGIGPVLFRATADSAWLHTPCWTARTGGPIRLDATQRFRLSARWSPYVSYAGTLTIEGRLDGATLHLALRDSAFPLDEAVALRAGRRPRFDGFVCLL